MAMTDARLAELREVEKQSHSVPVCLFCEVLDELERLRGVERLMKLDERLADARQSEKASVCPESPLEAMGLRVEALEGRVFKLASDAELATDGVVTRQTMLNRLSRLEERMDRECEAILRRHDDRIAAIEEYSERLNRKVEKADGGTAFDKAYFDRVEREHTGRLTRLEEWMEGTFLPSVDDFLKMKHALVGQNGRIQRLEDAAESEEQADAAPEPLKGRDFPLNREFRDTKTGTLLKVAVEYGKKFSYCKGCFYHKIDCVGYDRPLCGAKLRSDGQGVIFVSVEADAAPSEAVEGVCLCGKSAAYCCVSGVELGAICHTCFLRLRSFFRHMSLTSAAMFFEDESDA